MLIELKKATKDIIANAINIFFNPGIYQTYTMIVIRDGRYHDYPIMVNENVTTMDIYDICQEEGLSKDDYMIVKGKVVKELGKSFEDIQ